MNEDYQSVACAGHSEYELMAMHSSRVLLDGQTEQGPVEALECRVNDLKTTQGAEFLIVEDASGRQYSIRLDRIKALRKPDQG